MGPEKVDLLLFRPFLLSILLSLQGCEQGSGGAAQSSLGMAALSLLALSLFLSSPSHGSGCLPVLSTGSHGLTVVVQLRGTFTLRLEHAWSLRSGSKLGLHRGSQR